MEKSELKLFEVYTLEFTGTVYANSIQDAIETWTKDDLDEDDEIIGIIEVSCFHKKPQPRPDLI